MIRIGVTGGIGSGKTTVCRMFAELGVSVYDTDSHAKALMTDDTDVRVGIVEAFGERSYTAEGLDRAYLASQVFTDGERLERLNSIVHPAVKADFRRWCGQHADEEYVLLESAILFDAGFEHEVDLTLAVVAPHDLRVERTCRRSGLTVAQVESRMANQISDRQLRSLADYTIENMSLESLHDDVGRLDRIFRDEARKKRE